MVLVLYLWLCFCYVRPRLPPSARHKQKRWWSMATLTPALAHPTTLSTSLLGGSSLNTFPFPLPFPFPFPFTFTFSFWFRLWFIFQLLFMWFSLLLFLFVFLFSLSFAFSVSVCRCSCCSCFLSGVEIRSLRLRMRRLVRAKMLMNINATGWVSVAAHWVCNWAKGVEGRYQGVERNILLVINRFVFPLNLPYTVPDPAPHK